MPRKMVPYKLILILLTSSLYSTLANPAESLNVGQYQITRTWDSQAPPDNAVINLDLQLIPLSEGNSPALHIHIDAPFYNEPRLPPNTPTNRPTPGLWNYEVVEAFFLNADGDYLEIELGPRGHYINLYFKGRHNLVTDQIPLQKYTTTFSEGSRWTGDAYIHGSYFPCNVTKFNAYGIHKADSERVYMALFPVVKGEYTAPDFHRLETFGPIQFDKELNNNCSTG